MADRWVAIGVMNGWNWVSTDWRDGRKEWGKKKTWIAGIFRDEEEAKGWIAEIDALKPPPRSPNFMKKSEWLSERDPKYAKLAPDEEHQVFYKIESAPEMNWFPEGA